MIVVYNPQSGSALDEAVIRRLFNQHQIKIEKLMTIDEIKELRSYVQKGTIIAVIGGDGTISAVAQQLVATKAVLIPLPGGTLNHFTKDLGIPQDIEAAIAALSKAKTHHIDVASVNDRIFINNSSLGLYPHSLHVREAFEDSLGKWPALVIASVRSLLRFRTYEVTIDGKTFKTPFIFVGNNVYKFDGAGGIVRKHLSKGVLSVFVAKTTTRWGLLKILLWALIGKARLLDEFDQRTEKALTIKTNRRRLSVAYDGEVWRTTSPVRYEIQAGALNVRY